MKKTTSCLFVIFIIFSFSAFATNEQEILALDSIQYKYLEHLYIVQGYALPFSSYPYSVAEFKVALTNIKSDLLTESDKVLYDNLVEGLTAKPDIKTPGFNLGFTGIINLSTFLQTNKNPLTRIYETTLTEFSINRSSLSFITDAWVANNFYGYASLSLGNINLTRDPFEGYVNTNIPGYDSNFKFSFDNVDANIPYRAFLSAGGNNWNVQLGRESLSWGNGITGNFALSSHIPYHNLIKFTAFSSKLKYTFLTSFFPHPQNYYLSDGTLAQWQKQGNIVDGLKAFIAHRFEFRLAQNKLLFAITEAIMYQSATNAFDLSVFSPLMLFHNFYIKGNANSLLTLEANYTPIKNLNLYFQGVVDDLAIPGESKPGVSQEARPNAFGLMLGFTSFLSTSENAGLEINGEVAYTTPYLYLRNNGTDDSPQTSYGVNFIVANRYFKGNGLNGNDIFYNLEFLGYPYGGDAIVSTICLNYNHADKWSVGSSLLYLVHGTFDLFTRWSQVSSEGVTLPSAEDTQTPTTTHPNTGNEKDTAATLRNAVSHTILTSFSGGYHFTDRLRLYSQLDFLSIYNNNNIVSNKWENNIRFTISFSMYTNFR